MGFFSDLTKAVEVVGGIALIASGGVGILAGSLLEASFASQQGWLGGGAKNFFSSGVGQDLTLAVGLASGAMAISQELSAVTPLAATGANTADMGVGAAGVPNSLAANVASSTTQSFADSYVYSPNSLALASQATLPPDYLAAAPGDIASMTAQALPSSLQLASDAGLVPLNPTLAAQASTPEQTSAAGLTSAQTNPNPTQGPGAGTPITTNANPQTAGTPGMMSQVGSFLGTAAGKVGDALSTPAGMIMGGQALSGFAQGKAQENIMQRQLAAAQWGNTQWENPAQVAQLQSAAAAPINVPSGYLARAANARAIMNGSVSQTTPLSGAPPPAMPAPSLPTPGTQPPGSAGAGPVPLYMANQPTRGGVIGG